MPPETLKLLEDMRQAADHVRAFTAGKTYEDYISDVFLRSAVERQFEIIGEAMTRLVKRDRRVAEHITDYRKISGFRNPLIHGYDSVDHVISWGIINETWLYSTRSSSTSCIQ
jgi:uncharacterized protein with HEPN domain